MNLSVHYNQYEHMQRTNKIGKERKYISVDAVTHDFTLALPFSPSSFFASSQPICIYNSFGNYVIDCPLSLGDKLFFSSVPSLKTLISSSGPIGYSLSIGAYKQVLANTKLIDKQVHQWKCTYSMHA